MPRSHAFSARDRARQRRIDLATPRGYLEPAKQRETGWSAFTDVPAIPGVAILPLRLFLGLTFIYAAWQKLTDPGFLNAGAGTYVGHQILGFSRGSPIHGLLLHAMGYAVAVGVLTIITELVIGLLILLGLFTRLAALLGLFLNLVFFLSASWHTYPYFMGSDVVFVMCWLTLMLTGPGPFALDTIVRVPLAEKLRTYAGVPLAAALQRLLNGPLPGPTENRDEEPSGRSGGPRQLVVTRAEVLVGAIGALVLVVLGLAPRGGVSAGSLTVAPTRTGATTPPPTNPHGSGGTTNIPAGARKIGNISQLPPNSAGAVTDPKSGDPAIVIHTSGSQLYAYDAVCTHAGCTVEYDPQSKLLVCPCHGAEYDPTQDAQVVAGPAPSPLTKLPITVDAKGNIYLA
jgi:thiosulfate dehydrogenase [quinone] large subunit